MFWLKLLLVAALCMVLFQAGLWVIRTIGRAPPPPPPPGELRRINVKYRCAVCGMEMRVMLAADEDPEPPRHCMEEMVAQPARE